MINDVELLAYEVADSVDKSWDAPFLRRMQESVIEYRAAVYKQEFDKNGRFPSGGEDSIILTIKSVPPAECLNDEIECEVRRTTYKVPRAIRKGRSPIPFAFVGTSNQETSFIYVRPEEVRSILEGTKFIKNKFLYAFYNDYIYTYNYEGGKLVVRDVFSDPRKLLTLLDCNKRPCKTEITIDGDMKRTIKLMMYEELRQSNVLPPEQAVKLNEKEV
jgi:hypothetical protein